MSIALVIPDRKLDSLIEKLNAVLPGVLIQQWPNYSAPELVPESSAWLDIRSAHTLDPIEAWSNTVLAGTHAKSRDGSSFVVVVGRHGGPEFLASELARLGHMAALAASVQTP